MLLSKTVIFFEADKIIEGFSPQTLKAYGLQAKLLVNYFGNTKMKNFTTQQLKQYLSVSGKDLKPSSLSHRIRFLRSLFRWSHEEGIIDSNPASKIKEPKVGKRIPKLFKEREIEHLRGCLFYSNGESLV